MFQNQTEPKQTGFTVVVPAAGIGSRMQAAKPKQYLPFCGKTLLECTLEQLISHPDISHIVLALNPQDTYFESLEIRKADWITRVDGGEDRASSVYNGLQQVKDDWVLVHDAARPCVTHTDISKLLELSEGINGGLLACPVRDTMKRAKANAAHHVDRSEPRENLWHALTPQFFPTQKLQHALEKAQQEKVAITDEASALEFIGEEVILVEGSSDNIKVTRPEDLRLAEFFYKGPRHEF